MARPQEVVTDIMSIRQNGIDTIVSLLEPAEATQCGLKDEASMCSDLGITFLSHPIRDMHLPDPESFAAFTRNIAHRLANGANIAVHCYASIGRSGMLTCATMGHFNFTSEQALKHVSTKRGVTVPDTTEQAAFIRSAIAQQIIGQSPVKVSSET